MGIEMHLIFTIRPRKEEIGTMLRSCMILRESGVKRKRRLKIFSHDI